MFYAEKPSQSWLPERLVDWLAVNLFPFVYHIHLVLHYFAFKVVCYFSCTNNHFVVLAGL